MTNKNEKCPTCGYDRPTFTSDDGTSGFIPQPDTVQVHQCDYLQGKGVPCYICNPHLKRDAVQADEVKPCPFCGPKEKVNSDQEDRYPYTKWCENCGAEVNRDVWNNAWAHKRITLADTLIESQKKRISDLNEGISEQQEKIDELEKEDTRKTICTLIDKIKEIHAANERFEERRLESVYQLEESRKHLQDATLQTDEALAYKAAYREVAIKFRNLWSEQVHTMDQYSASEQLVDEQAQRLMEKK